MDLVTVQVELVLCVVSIALAETVCVEGEQVFGQGPELFGQLSRLRLKAHLIDLLSQLCVDGVVGDGEVGFGELLHDLEQSKFVHLTV